MPQILHIETSGKNCSVAVSKAGKNLDNILITEERSHATLLTQSIQDLLQSLNLKVSDLNAVAVGEGPGSYTGLRIGISAAKGICYGANLPLIAVPTLEIMLQQLISTQKHFTQNPYLFIPMIDARRMEVYDCCYNHKYEIIREVQADIIDENSFFDLLQNNNIVFFGDGSEKCQSVITHQNANFVNGILPDAQYMVAIAEKLYKAQNFVDLAYYEPFYLKEFQATISKNPVLQNLKKS